MSIQISEVEKALQNAKDGCASKDDKKTLAYMANSGLSSRLVRDCEHWLKKC